ncbi:MAG: hypothetical protein ABL876_00335 [Chitinophagaceae bacterium]
MSILEKKALAFEKLAALQNEEAIDEIIAYIDVMSDESKIKFSVLQQAVSIMKERSSVLEKLAQ